MKIGMVGLGKLGLPVALTIESRGHEVHGYDISNDPYSYLGAKQIPYKEEGIQPLLDDNDIRLHPSVGSVVANSELIFIAIQTPHDPQYEGTTKLSQDRQDFDYTYLKEGIRVVADVCAAQKVARTIVGISTCLPGTFLREISPLLNDYTKYVYSPQFIAMGSVLKDYLNPEFNLIGVHDDEAAGQLAEFYLTINDAPNVVTDITTAEGIKVSYNTWITAKTVIANAWGEIAYKTGMNFEDIFKAWSLATDRILSPRYMHYGMSDGGSCHPRDNIALSYLAKQVDLSHDIFEDLMRARENYEEWHARLAISVSKKNKLPLILLGRAFKPDTTIETGSAAILLANIIKERGYAFIHKEDLDTLPVAVYFIATNHSRYKDYKFPEGSIVINPSNLKGVTDENFNNWR